MSVFVGSQTYKFPLPHAGKPDNASWKNAQLLNAVTEFSKRVEKKITLRSAQVAELKAKIAESEESATEPLFDQLKRTQDSYDRLMEGSKQIINDLGSGTITAKKAEMLFISLQGISRPVEPQREI
jgi:hypothetical protein